MKQYTIYVCETCGYESRSVDDMEAHEAGHWGLTVTEFHEYNALKSFAKYMSGIVSNTGNADTRGKFEKAIDDLIAFEEAHSIEQRI